MQSFQGQEVKGQLAGGEGISWRPPAQLVMSVMNAMWHAVFIIQKNVFEILYEQAVRETATI